MKSNLQYVTDAHGKKIAVILPIEDYENLLEDLHVMSAAYETKGQPTVPLSEVIDELRAEGKID
jgi:hypothetical protein